MILERSSILNLNIYVYEEEHELIYPVEYIKRKNKYGLKNIRFVQSKNSPSTKSLKTIDLNDFKEKLNIHKNTIKLYRKTVKNFIPEIKNKLILAGNKLSKVDEDNLSEIIEQITILSYIKISLMRTSDPENEFFGKVDTAITNTITKALLNYEPKDDILSNLMYIKDFLLGFEIWNNITYKTMSYLTNKEI